MAVINKSRTKNFPDKKNYQQRLNPTSIDYKVLNSLIYNQGVRVRVYTTLPCPNRKSIDGGEHEVNCPVCNGTELVDIDPKETTALCHSISTNEQFNMENMGGTWQEQTVNMTFPTGIELLYFAKIELLDFTMLFYQMLQRQVGEVDVAKYPVHSVNALIDKDGRRYYPGTDFDFDGSRNIQWRLSPGANRPAAGTVYSMHYNTYVVFRTLRALHSNRFGADGRLRPGLDNIEYQQQWYCKKDFLVDRQDVNGTPLAPNKIMAPE